MLAVVHEKNVKKQTQTSINYRQMTEYMRADDARQLMEISTRPARIALHEMIRYAQRKIKLAAQNREYDCIFVIPAMLADLPPYSWERMQRDLKLHLEMQHFYCKTVPGTPVIYINWRDLGRATGAAAMLGGADGKAAPPAKRDSLSRRL
jgi:hypothetical protein